MEHTDGETPKALRAVISRPLVPVAAVLLLLAAWALDAPPEMRAPLTALVLLGAGGLAFAPEAPVALMVAVSLAIDASVVISLLLLGIYSPALASAGLLLLVFAGMGTRIVPHAPEPF